MARDRAPLTSPFAEETEEAVFLWLGIIRRRPTRRPLPTGLHEEDWRDNKGPDQKLFHDVTLRKGWLKRDRPPVGHGVASDQRLAVIVDVRRQWNEFVVICTDVLPVSGRQVVMRKLLSQIRVEPISYRTTDKDIWGGGRRRANETTEGTQRERR